MDQSFDQRVGLEVHLFHLVLALAEQEQPGRLKQDTGVQTGRSVKVGQCEDVRKRDAHTYPHAWYLLESSSRREHQLRTD